jgi:hypothetical protein
MQRPDDSTASNPSFSFPPIAMHACWYICFGLTARKEGYWQAGKTPEQTPLSIALTFVTEDEISVAKIKLITLPLNANKSFVRPKSSMRHVAVVNAIDVKQKNCRAWAY